MYRTNVPTTRHHNHVTDQVTRLLSPATTSSSSSSWSYQPGTTTADKTHKQTYTQTNLHTPSHQMILILYSNSWDRSTTNENAANAHMTNHVTLPLDKPRDTTTCLSLKKQDIKCEDIKRLLMRTSRMPPIKRFVLRM